MVMVGEEFYTTPWSRPDINSNGSDKGFYLHSDPEGGLGLKENLDFESRRIRKKWDCIGLIDGMEGCLSSKAWIKILFNGKPMEVKINHLYAFWSIIQKFNLPMLKFQVRSQNEKDEMVWEDIKGVTYSGKKEVFELTLLNQKTIEATSTHKFLTFSKDDFKYKKDIEWKPLSSLTEGDFIRIENGMWSEITSITSKGIKKTYDIECVSIHNFIANGILVHNSGKSSLGKAICAYMASLNGQKFTLDDVVYTQKQFEDWIEKAPPGSACLWDEFVLAGLSTDALTPMQKALIRRMVTMRSRRLFVLCVIPYVFLLRKFFAIARTRFLIHVYSPDNLSRGAFQYFSYPKKKQLYISGYKFWDYSGAHADFLGDFTTYDGVFFDESEYEKKKRESVEDEDEDDFEAKVRWKEKFETLILRLNKCGMSAAQLTALSSSQRHVIDSIIENNPNYKLPPAWKFGKSHNIKFLKIVDTNAPTLLSQGEVKEKLVGELQNARLKQKIARDVVNEIYKDTDGDTDGEVDLGVEGVYKAAGSPPTELTQNPEIVTQLKKELDIKPPEPVLDSTDELEETAEFMIENEDLPPPPPKPKTEAELIKERILSETTY